MWRRFGVILDEKVINRFLTAVGKDAEKAFKKGMRSRKSGRVYSGRSGRRIRASAPGEYPAIDTGDLERSIKVRQRKRSVTIGTNTFYAKFLREGTRRMARRKMSDNALEEGIKTARHRLKGFAHWTHR